jgi:hypothetical protein
MTHQKTIAGIKWCMFPVCPTKMSKEMVNSAEFVIVNNWNHLL